MPRPDFSLRLLHHTQEAEPPAAEFYAGIYTVTLRDLLPVVFVPAFAHTSAKWMEAVLDIDVDNVRSVQQARLVTAAFATYLVTPDAACAGQTHPFVWQSGPDAQALRGVMFCVMPEQFSVFAQELADLDAQMRSAYDARPVSELLHLSFVRYLLAVVLASPELGGYERRQLGR